jgi:hypothetical protein
LGAGLGAERRRLGWCGASIGAGASKRLRLGAGARTGGAQAARGVSARGSWSAGAVQTATSGWWSVQEHVRAAPSGRRERARRWSFGVAVWRGLARGQQGPTRGVRGDSLARAAAAR